LYKEKKSTFYENFFLLEKNPLKKKTEKKMVQKWLKRRLNEYERVVTKKKG